MCAARETAPVVGALAAAPADSLPAVRDRAARDRLLADAEAHRTAERWTAALAIYEHLLAADPRDDVAYRMRALTLTDLGASYRARELVAAWPEAFADFQRDRIEGDAVARAIGWGMAYPERLEARDAELERALQALRELQAKPERTNWEKRRVRIDSLVALSALRRYEETVAEYEALYREDPDLPAYAHGPAGDSLLALRRPAEAQVVLERALQKSPNDVDTRILLAYAFLEQERFDRALPLVRELMASQPAWLRQPGATADHENWARYKAETTYAQMVSFAHDHAQAERMIDALVRVGPNRAATQASLGAIYYRRGWPSRAIERYDMALTLDPRNRDAQLGRVSALFELQRPDLARAANERIQALYAGDLHAQRMAREVELRTGSQGRVSWVEGDNDATTPAGSPFGVRDRRVGLEAWSPLLADRWRVGVVGDELWAELRPDPVRYRRIGGAIDYRFDRLGLRGAVYSVSEPDDDTAWTIAASWRVSDTFYLRGSLAENDVDTSLQARRAGFEADSVAIGASWRPNDLGAVDAQLKRLRYSDGNERDQASIYGRWRLHSAPHLLVDGLASGWWSRGSEIDRPYYNPTRDAMATVGVRLDHILWRRWARHLRQKLEVNVGPYWQEGYGTHWVPSASYRHEWRPAQGHTFEYGVSWSRPVYDGGRERRLAFELAYRWGF